MSTCADWSALASDNERLISREEAASYLRAIVSALSGGELCPPDGRQAGAAAGVPAVGFAAGATAAA
jgi:hypothetical protein